MWHFIYPPQMLRFIWMAPNHKLMLSVIFQVPIFKIGELFWENNESLNLQNSGRTV